MFDIKPVKKFFLNFSVSYLFFPFSFQKEKDETSSDSFGRRISETQTYHKAVKCTKCGTVDLKKVSSRSEIPRNEEIVCPDCKSKSNLETGIRRIIREEIHKTM